MVYQTTTAPLVRDVLAGYTAAVFAYGATGSGKTHTMLGPNPKKARTPQGATNSGNVVKPNSDGLMVKAISEIFNFVEAAENPSAFKVGSLFEQIFKFIMTRAYTHTHLKLKLSKYANLKLIPDLVEKI
jgi:Kinesin motor domain